MLKIIEIILAVIGGIVVILTAIDYLFSVTPKLAKLKNSIVLLLAERSQFKKLQKVAIKSNIEETVNLTVSDLQDELPYGWINRASIKWVRRDSVDLIEEEELIIRIKPSNNQDSNLINGVYYFFRKCLFPNLKEVVPSNIRMACELYITKRALQKQQPFLTNQFEREIVENEIKKDSTIVTYYGGFERIDQRGYFTSVFLRETCNVIENSRFNELRNEIAIELDQILDHLKRFNEANSNIPNDLWSKQGKATSFALILVARPTHNSTLPYLKRALENREKSVKRIYVAGCNMEYGFYKSVIQSIAKIDGFKIIEEFRMHRDYRGEPGGYCALFEANNVK
jgi:hypothetical protein